jgi:hypothetical protein
MSLRDQARAAAAQADAARPAQQADIWKRRHAKVLQWIGDWNSRIGISGTPENLQIIWYNDHFDGDSAKATWVVEGITFSGVVSSYICTVYVNGRHIFSLADIGKAIG